MLDFDTTPWKKADGIAYHKLCRLSIHEKSIYCFRVLRMKFFKSGVLDIVSIDNYYVKASVCLRYAFIRMRLYLYRTWVCAKSCASLMFFDYIDIIIVRQNLQICCITCFAVGWPSFWGRNSLVWVMSAPVQYSVWLVNFFFNVCVAM